MYYYNLFIRVVRRSFIAIFVSVCFLATPAVDGAQGFAVGSLDLGLTGQPGWFEWFSSTDSPEGAYLGTIRETESVVDGTVPLGRTLQPGRYYAAWKVLDYGAGGTLDFAIGDSTLSTTTLNSADFNGQWTAPVQIDVLSDSTTVKITFRRSRPLGTRQLFLLRGLYISPLQSEIVSADDAILNPLYPTGLDSSPARKGNILENSSFEV